MPDIPLKSQQFGNIDPRGLAAGFVALGQPAVPTADGIVLSPRASRVGWLRVHDLVAGDFKPDEFTDAFIKIDRRVDASTRLGLANRAEAKAAVKRWLDAGDMGQVAAKFLETTQGPDERHLYLREIVLPVFFEKFPKGRLACVTYDEQANGYLALLNNLKRSQILNSSDPKVLKSYAGKSAMSSFSLNVPAEMIWLMLPFVGALTFPETFAFVASCEHLYFLVFITDTPVDISQGEERYPPLSRLMPKILSVLDAKDRDTRILLDDKFVLPDRSHPFNRRDYSAHETYALLEYYVGKLDGLLHWMCEATRFVAPDGAFDLDFALQTYLTIFVLLNASYRVIMEQTDIFARKMALFDVLELYAGLVDCSSPAEQAEAWKMHCSAAFIGGLLSNVAAYATPFGDDFAQATKQLLSENADVVAKGLIYGQNSDGSVNVPNKGVIPFDEYVVKLLRALRNTKHGFAIRDEDYLAIHAGDISNDLPDYVIPLWLNFAADQSAYLLKH